MTRRRVRLARLPRAAADVLAALAALLRAASRVRRRATGALVAPANVGPAGVASPAGVARTDVVRRVQRADAALRRALRLLPRQPNCLVRALALADLLARAGVPGPLIRVGVRRDGATMDAHAWVELDGRVVGDDPDVARRFTPLGSVTPAARP